MKLAVLGSPIAHSKSPVLHEAAYRQLGLDWGYEAVEVDGAGLRAFVESRGVEWRGLSLTMPLKRDILPLLDEVDPLVTLAGAANTVLLMHGRRLGFNTDIYGITRAFHERGVSSIASALILGGGATAGNAIIAAAQLGASRVTVVVRDPARASDLVTIAERSAVAITITRFEEFVFADAPDVLITTLPNGTDVPLAIPADVRATSMLLDVAYKPSQNSLALDWKAGNSIGGLEMLLYQALIQVRIFVNLDQDEALDHEDEVLASMRAAVTN